MSFVLLIFILLILRPRRCYHRWYHPFFFGPMMGFGFHRHCYHHGPYGYHHHHHHHHY